jgi:hypothetical protein
MTLVINFFPNYILRKEHMFIFYVIPNISGHKPVILPVTECSQHNGSIDLIVWSTVFFISAHKPSTNVVPKMAHKN